MGGVDGEQTDRGRVEQLPVGQSVLGGAQVRAEAVGHLRDAVEPTAEFPHTEFPHITLDLDVRCPSLRSSATSGA